MGENLIAKIFEQKGVYGKEIRKSGVNVGVHFFFVVWCAFN